ncbi:MAG: glycerate kinase [Candidatus Bathyarchaeota archaeon]|nr:glycerate kinase [Candidatus Bathyarchaeota archaeon]MDW8040259.1 glycerate kinase [Nitrososphaerota archaeon]
MTVVIKNLEQLIHNGQTQVDRKARELALKSLKAAVEAVDPKRLILSKLVLKDSILEVGGYTFDLRQFRNLYVIGGGKASGFMAEALETVLGERITEGIVNVPKGGRYKTSVVKPHEASHPIPDDSGVEGVKRMLEIAERATEKDLIICLISGGGSSLMPLPRKGITLADKRKITEDLLKCGATINEINAVRKHISGFKGGWLAKKAYPATVLNLILSDVLGDPLDSIASGPTVPDSTTFSDAVKILKKYNLWEKAPESIKKVLLDGEKGLIPETPKANDEAFKKVFNVVIGNCRDASTAACEALKSEGLNTLLLTSLLEGEARHVGTFLASIAREVVASGNPVQKPAAIVAGGETTVTVVGEGKGGRNQEIALAAALKIKGLEGCVVASLSTDGVDGPTDAAGAVADGKTIARAEKTGLKAEDFLAENDSYTFFSKLDDLIYTGPTGTNVNDVSVVITI